MEPQIQYVTTSDGVSIAYYAMGQGPAMLFLVLPMSHLEAEWQIDPLRMVFTAMAQQTTLVRLDPRGFGLSDRDADDFTVDSFVLDIEAVVDRLGLDELRIFAIGFATVPALAYTARHPDKVTHLVQIPAAASGEDMGSERLQKLMELGKLAIVTLPGRGGWRERPDGALLRRWQASERRFARIPSLRPDLDHFLRCQPRLRAGAR